MPDDFQASIQKNIEKSKGTGLKAIAMAPQHRDETINYSEMRDTKIKLSRKEKELVEALDQFEKLTTKFKIKETEVTSLQSERDRLKLKNEILQECIDKNQLKLDPEQEEMFEQTMSLAEEQ